MLATPSGMLMDVSESAPENAYALMLVTPDGIKTAPAQLLPLVTTLFDIV
jgi:hypothetical protein